MDRKTGDLVSSEMDLSGIHPVDPGDGHQRCRLSGPVGPDETDNLPFPNLQGNPLEDLDQTVRVGIQMATVDTGEVEDGVLRCHGLSADLGTEPAQ
jgi:hypothetical protein